MWLRRYYDAMWQLYSRFGSAVTTVNESGYLGSGIGSSNGSFESWEEKGEEVMLAPADNKFGPTENQHSIANRLAMNIPNPGWDENPLIQVMKANLESGFQGYGKGISGLTFDGTGLLGTGLFSGDVTTWGVPEMLAGTVGIYAVYAMFFQAKQTKYRMEIGAGRRRKSRASKLRAKAAKLEGQTTGIF